MWKGNRLAVPARPNRAAISERLRLTGRKVPGLRMNRWRCLRTAQGFRTFVEHRGRGEIDLWLESLERQRCGGQWLGFLTSFGMTTSKKREQEQGQGQGQGQEQEQEQGQEQEQEQGQGQGQGQEQGQEQGRGRRAGLYSRVPGPQWMPGSPGRPATHEVAAAGGVESVPLLTRSKSRSRLSLEGRLGQGPAAYRPPRPRRPLTRGSRIISLCCLHQ